MECGRTDRPPTRVSKREIAARVGAKITDAATEFHEWLAANDDQSDNDPFLTDAKDALSTVTSRLAMIASGGRTPPPRDGQR